MAARLLTPLLLVFSLASLTLLQGCAGPGGVAGGAAAGAASQSADRRGSDMVSRDKEIELSIGKQIFEHPQLKQRVHININSYNGSVLLTGEASNAERRTLMAEIARRIPGVTRVYNEVTVGAESTLGQRTRDGLITTNILGRITIEKDLHPNHFKVVTEARHVYLMGIVTRREADVATHLARKVDGVAQVVRLFEYRN